MGGELRVPRRVERGDLAFDLAETLPGLTLEQGRAVRVVAVPGGDLVLDQGAARHVQLPPRVEGRAHDGPHRRLEKGCEAGQHGRVDRVGLGRPADRFGEAAAWRGLTLTIGRPASARRRSKAR